MKIDLLCNDGSPLGITSKTLWGDSKRIGIGGAEYALITMCEAWAKAGHEVVLYNNPWEADASPFEQRFISAFNPQDNRDVLIIFRSPNPMGVEATGLKVWWSCDQKSVGDFKGFAPLVDKIVCISDFHMNYFKTTYGIENSIVIDLPVRVDDYEGKDIEKVKHQCLFSSVPDRGLHVLGRMWPAIVEAIPDAHVVITSDYRLWGAGAMNEKHRLYWMKLKNFTFLGAVPRARLIEEELKAELLPYPCMYEELFCIAVAEAQVAGCYPITTLIGALEETNMGALIDTVAPNQKDDKRFSDLVIQFLLDENLRSKSVELQRMARERFSPQRILKEWDRKVFQ